MCNSKQKEQTEPLLNGGGRSDATSNEKSVVKTQRVRKGSGIKDKKETLIRAEEMQELTCTP